jgi:2-polyprenyl-6-methoxyphenol hydroxylase-like FAD-dependent oxidoreductase
MNGHAKTPITLETPVVVVGGGPVGLITAYGLARLDVPCLLAEQSLETTKWPKMDLTNCRSMEILRMWGLADEYRALKGSVPKEANFDTIFYSTAALGGEIITKWVCMMTDMHDDDPV